MKIIDLLNKIANGEEVPEMIKFDGVDYRLNYANTYVDKNSKYIFQKYNNLILNDEVEIIEEPQEHKIPEKFKVHSWGDKDKYGNYVDSPFPTEEELMNKINEILDYLEVK